MPRTTTCSQEIEIISDSSEPISVTPFLIDRLLATGDYSNLISLYLFYYRTARYQKTNQPWATISFVAKGMSWGVEKVSQKKQALIKLGLIEEIQGKREDGTFGKLFIKVNYIHGLIPPPPGNDRDRENTGGGKNPVPVESGGNALSGERGNAKEEPESDSKRIPNQDILKIWNRIVNDSPIKKINKISSHRAEHLNARSKDFPTRQAWADLFQKVVSTPFLRGDNERGWKADFDWIIENDDNPTKVMEGKYDDDKPSPSRAGSRPAKFTPAPTWGRDNEFDSLSKTTIQSGGNK